MLKFLLAIRTTNIDIAKIFKVYRNMVIRRIEENELTNMLEEPADEKMCLIAAKN